MAVVDVIEEAKKVLNEEKWTRTTIETYAKKNFVRMDKIIKQAIEDGKVEDLKHICNEHLKHSSNSIAALYMAGILSLETSAIDDYYLPKVIRLFDTGKKWSLASFIAERMLSYREDKYALRVLESIYQRQGHIDDLVKIRERIVFADIKDYQTPKSLGDHFLAQGDRENAAFYYRVALERVLNQGVRTERVIEEIWNKLVDLIPEKLDFFLNASQRIYELIHGEKTGKLLLRLAETYIGKEDYDTAIKILKLALLKYSPKDKEIKNNLIKVYKSRFASHSRIQDYLKDLEQIKRESLTAQDMKKILRYVDERIAFDVGNYVYHRSWGLGVIKQLDGEYVIIDFENKKNHRMSLKIALNSLKVLPEDHIWVMKKFKLDELKKLAEEKPAELVKIVLKSLGGEGAVKDIKGELVPDVVPDKKWSSWWSRVKNEIKQHPEVGQSLRKRNVYVLRDRPVTIEEELVEEFRKKKDFDSRYEVLMKFVKYHANLTLPVASEVVEYFKDISSNGEGIQQILSYVNLSSLALSFRGVNPPEESRARVLEAISNLSKDEVCELLDRFVLPEMKKEFLKLVRESREDWTEIFSSLITKSPVSRIHDYLLDELVSYEQWNAINKAISSILANYRTNPDLFVWISRHILSNEEEFKDNIIVQGHDIILRMVHLWGEVSKAVDQKENLTVNKRLLEQIQAIMIEDEALINTVQTAEEGVVRTILDLLETMEVVDEKFMSELRKIASKRFPELSFETKGKKKRHPFIVTKRSYERMQREYDELVNVELARAKREVEEMTERGELREDLEYRSALERYEHIKARIDRITAELSSARILEPDEISDDYVDVGTVVEIEDLDTGKKEMYTILGIWDADPEKNIISYKSPLGSVLLDHYPGEVVEFSFGDEKKRYKIASVKKAPEELVG